MRTHERWIQIYAFIEKYKKEHDGADPTIREICKGINIASSGGVHERLCSMRNHGWIVIEKSGHRIHYTLIRNYDVE